MIYPAVSIVRRRIWCLPIEFWRCGFSTDWIFIGFACFCRCACVIVCALAFVGLSLWVFTRFEFCGSTTSCRMIHGIISLRNEWQRWDEWKSFREKVVTSTDVNEYAIDGAKPPKAAVGYLHSAQGDSARKEAPVGPARKAIFLSWTVTVIKVYRYITNVHIQRHSANAHSSLHARLPQCRCWKVLIRRIFALAACWRCPLWRQRC